eukprot:3672497-Prymnesium_polylepis.1
MWVCPFPQVSTPSTAHTPHACLFASAVPVTRNTHKHCTRTAHRWPGDAWRLLPMGHRAFLRAGSIIKFPPKTSSSGHIAVV